MLRYKDLFCSCVVVHYINWISWITAGLLELQELEIGQQRRWLNFISY